jgi:hypothetical protein
LTHWLGAFRFSQTNLSKSQYFATSVLSFLFMSNRPPREGGIPRLPSSWLRRENSYCRACIFLRKKYVGQPLWNQLAKLAASAKLRFLLIREYSRPACTFSAELLEPMRFSTSVMLSDLDRSLYACKITPFYKSRASFTDECAKTPY